MKTELVFCAVLVALTALGVCMFHFWEARTQVTRLVVICLAAALVLAIIAIAMAIIFSFAF